MQNSCCFSSPVRSFLFLTTLSLAGASFAQAADPPNAACELALHRENLKSAQTLCSKALEILRQPGKRPSEPLAIAFDNMGKLAMALNQPNRAETHFRSGHATRVSLYGKDHQFVAVSLRHIAESLLAQGKGNDAEPLLLRAMNICESSTGKTSPQTAAARHALGMFYARAGKLAQAEQHFRQEIAILEKNGPSSVPTLAVALNNLGFLLQSGGKIAEAESHYRRSLELFDKAGPGEEVRQADPLLNLATLSQATGKLADAESLLLRLLAIHDARKGVDSLESADIHNRLGVLYSQAKALPKAEESLRKSLQIREKKLGANTLPVAESAMNLGLLLMQAGKPLDALPLMRHAAAATQILAGAQSELTKARWIHLERLYSTILQQGKQPSAPASDAPSRR